MQSSSTLPRGRFTTTSSSSSTSETPIQFVKGVGPRLGAVLANREIRTVRDLLYFFPRAYEDRTRIKQVTEIVEGETATLALKVASSRKIPLRGRGRAILDVRAGDASGTIGLKWFNVPRGMEARFVPGAEFIATGRVKLFMGKPEIAHPEITWSVGASLEKAGHNVGRVVPIYTEIEGVATRLLRKIQWEALEKYVASLPEDLPDSLLQRHSLPPLPQAVRTIHFPDDDAPETLQAMLEFNTPAHHRLIYEEFLKFEYLILKQKLRTGKQAARAFPRARATAAATSLEALLPFKLTGDQKKAISEILSDLAEPHPMNRLIQGDVGSGKTAVAFLTIGAVLAEGAQAALMAPTEILAEQHYANAVKLFGGRLNVALLTGKTPASERQKILGRLKSGEPILLIGTHALIEDPVEFADLAYVLIDEQHRFGVEQRRTLKKKGVRTDPVSGKPVLPHNLILSATPIPRTLALTAYGDLGVTSIRELPPGRSPVVTKVCSEKKGKAEAFETIRKELRAGHQAYFIYPLVNESEAEGFTQLKSAVAESERLQREVFAEFRVGMLHGQMKPDEKHAVMERFKRHELDILVSTTVVEVGVDVPNATIMVVEHAERFGLSQLHQLRGRVGRGSAQSYCFLLAHPRVGEITAQRLDVLEATTDGFKIAEADLEIRGPGEFLGTRQAGGLLFQLAHLVRDREWLLKARDDAADLLRADPDLQSPENARLRRYYEREGGLQLERLKTS